MKTTENPILLVEDDSVDVMTVKRALKEIHVANPVVNFENGEDALNYLRDFNNARPCVILLDLNMPIMNGIEFLREMKNDNVLKRTPVIALTTSEEPQDKISCFDLGVSDYIAKPVDYRQFVEIMRTIKAYWTIRGEIQ